MVATNFRSLADAAIRNHLHARVVSRFLLTNPGYRHMADDLKQEAAIGILKAVDSFDPNRGASFETHAWWIARSMISKLLNRGDPREVPMNDDGEIVAKRLAAPCEIQDANDRLDAPKIEAQIVRELRKCHHRNDVKDFVRLMHGETLQKLATERDVSRQYIHQKTRAVRERFAVAFPEIHAALNS